MILHLFETLLQRLVSWLAAVLFLGDEVVDVAGALLQHCDVPHRCPTGLNLIHTPELISEYLGDALAESTVSTRKN